MKRRENDDTHRSRGGDVRVLCAVNIKQYLVGIKGQSGTLKSY
jgi:mRNA-degrading endonuclease RelE of RelBE toxin-antitoxin system